MYFLDKMDRKSYTNLELKMFEKMCEDLIIWMFNTQDKRHAILEVIKRAFEYGRSKRK